jgi:hypothetical protein
VAEAGPAVVGADKALETGSVEDLVKLVTQDAAEGIEKRFRRALELKKHAGESVDKGREFVAVYVDYVHHVEGLHAAAASGGHHGEAEEGEGLTSHHAH